MFNQEKLMRQCEILVRSGGRQFPQIISIIQKFSGETVEVMNELNGQNIPFIQNYAFHFFLN